MGTGPHILLADDEAHVVLILARRLAAEGYRLTETSNGLEALEAARRDVPDLIITDLQMPQMSGLDLALALRGDPQTAPVPLIMLTGRGYTVDPATLAQTNICELRSKPFSARAIVQLVGEILGGRGAVPSFSHRAA